jgi:hypothetical protein
VLAVASAVTVVQRLLYVRKQALAAGEVRARSRLVLPEAGQHEHDEPAAPGAGSRPAPAESTSQDA